jgi:lysophospholipase L1-like esterase
MTIGGDDVVVDLDSHRQPEWATWVAGGPAHVTADEQARGWHHVTLLHGDIEDDTDAQLHQRLHQFAASLAPVDGAMFTRGGNDWTSWVYVSSNATLNRRAADRLTTWIRSNARTWWRLRTDGTMPRIDDATIAPAVDVHDSQLSYAAAIDQLDRTSAQTAQLWTQLQRRQARHRVQLTRMFVLGAVAGATLGAFLTALLLAWIG